ncbi:hypothetical protein C8R47DRAFT_1071368 [Mycena vitilis]|nr:hypothetical protein C8R47DRAFT_1071368 [Mycena vitilis]
MPQLHAVWAGPYYIRHILKAFTGFLNIVIMPTAPSIALSRTSGATWDSGCAHGNFDTVASSGSISHSALHFTPCGLIVTQGSYVYPAYDPGCMGSTTLERLHLELGLLLGAQHSGLIHIHRLQGLHQPSYIDFRIDLWMCAPKGVSMAASSRVHVPNSALHSKLLVLLIWAFRLPSVSICLCGPHLRFLSLTLWASSRVYIPQFGASLEDVHELPRIAFGHPRLWASNRVYIPKFGTSLKATLRCPQAAPHCVWPSVPVGVGTAASSRAYIPQFGASLEVSSTFSDFKMSTSRPASRLAIRARGCRHGGVESGVHTQIRHFTQSDFKMSTSRPASRLAIRACGRRHGGVESGVHTPIRCLTRSDFKMSRSRPASRLVIRARERWHGGGESGVHQFNSMDSEY